MTSLRARLEAVFTKYGYSVMKSDYDVIPCNNSRTAEILRVIQPSFLDALITACQEARPQPSREALINIFGYHMQGERHDHPEPCDRLADEILAWAAGEPMKPTWCSHLQYERPDDDLGCRTEGWYVCKTKSGINILVDEDWRQCPVCLTPRPAGA